MGGDGWGNQPYCGSPVATYIHVPKHHVVHLNFHDVIAHYTSTKLEKGRVGEKGAGAPFRWRRAHVKLRARLQDGSDGRASD